jgi:ethanolamine utilization microcompartment shell protein EutL
MNQKKFELRAYAVIDRMQPQYAAFVGTTVNGDIPIAGMSQLYMEVAPGNEVFRIADVALKSAEVKPASMIVEREFGMLEVHASDQAAVLASGRAVLEYLGLTEDDRVRPQIASAQVITNVDPYQAQLINRFRRGSMLVPGETLFVMETAPAAYVAVAANEAEKAAGIKIIQISNVGRFGRMFVSGSESEVLAAKEAAMAIIEGMSGL